MNVSKVDDMSEMFFRSESFIGDISRWDVSRVTNMADMFMHATKFNGGIWKWDVSRVTNMDHMFFEATSFKQNLCGDAWVQSEASKTDMLKGSSVSISSTVCTCARSPQRSRPKWDGRIGCDLHDCHVL